MSIIATPEPKPLGISSVILELMQNIAESQGRRTVSLGRDVALFDSGLDSLCIAMLVAELEDRYGIDPISAANETEVPVTIGDLIRLYETHVR